jgi:TolB protein
MQFQYVNTETAMKMKWSPDAEKMIVHSIASDNNNTLINITNTNKVEHGKYSVYGLAPVWSPDSSKILFSSDKIANRQLYVMNADGSNMIRITNEERGIMGNSTAWYPDSRTVLYAAINDGGIDILETNCEGGSKRRLNDYPVSEMENFKWSPDGSKIAFIAEQNNLFVMNTDGKNRKKLTNDNICHDFCWSPDSINIAFSTSGIQSQDSSNIFISNSETGEPLKIIEPDGVTDSMFAWSPDGTKLAFVVSGKNWADIYSVYPNGSGLSQLTANNGYNSYPSWSANAKSIVFTNNSEHCIRNGNPKIYIMNANGSSKNLITSGFYPVCSPR